MEGPRKLAKIVGSSTHDEQEHAKLAHNTSAGFRLYNRIISRPRVVSWTFVLTLSGFVQTASHSGMIVLEIVDVHVAHACLESAFLNACRTIMFYKHSSQQLKLNLLLQTPSTTLQDDRSKYAYPHIQNFILAFLD